MQEVTFEYGGDLPAFTPGLSHASAHYSVIVGRLTDSQTVNDEENIETRYALEPKERLTERVSLLKSLALAGVPTFQLPAHLLPATRDHILVIVPGGQRPSTVCCFSRGSRMKSPSA